MNRQMIYPTRQYKFYDKPVNLDIVPRCTLLCPKCQRQKDWYKKLPKGSFEEISVSDYQKILDCFSYVEWCGQTGDPIFHSKFFTLLEMSKDHRLDIHTAASHKPKEWWKKSFETKRDAKWIFGIDGLPKESSIYRINQDGEYLFEIMKMGVEMDMNIWWQMILFKYNQDSLEEVMSICEKNNINFKLIKSNRFTKNDALRPI